jgi:Tfp pilus assembly protein PilF
MKFGERQSDNVLKTAEYKENLHSEEQDLLLILNQASEAALRGNYLKAEDLLKPLIDNGNCQIEALDLMAKIYAQQGKYQQSQKLWLLLLENEPTNLHYISALKSCAIQQKPNYFIYQYSWLIITILIWFIVILSILVS